MERGNLKTARSTMRHGASSLAYQPLTCIHQPLLLRGEVDTNCLKGFPLANEGYLQASILPDLSLSIRDAKLYRGENEKRWRTRDGIAQNSSLSVVKSIYNHVPLDPHDKEYCHRTARARQHQVMIGLCSQEQDFSNSLHV